MCRSRLGNNKAVWSIEEFAEEVEVFGAKEEDGIQCLEPAQRVTLKLESGKFMRFQPHTGAQCNVIPVHLNRPTKKKDFAMRQVQPVNSRLVAFGGLTLDVISQVRLRVWHEDQVHKLD